MIWKRFVENKGGKGEKIVSYAICNGDYGDGFDRSRRRRRSEKDGYVGHDGAIEQ
jgi:hypothetical protein